ncbi:sterol desaturase family protein [Psychromonas sp.]|uniref:sterol desaturase family protein n=1 Tax=Psychromonas sp. TaxID=1884585 RepID=UPI00356264AC
MSWLESIISPLSFLFEADKRIYWLYLLSSGLLAFFISGKQFFSVKLWFNRSSLVDLCWLFINQWIFKLLVIPLFALQVSYALTINNFLTDLFGSGNYWQLNQPVLVILFTFILFISQDFAKFLVHFTLHKIPFLWRFHAVHHSATTLTPLTLYRIHPVEMLINSLRSLLIGALVSGLFVYLFKNPLGITQILGVNLFVFIFNIAASNLRHSPVWLGFSKCEYLFISPAQHQIHHSAAVQHFDKNFGSALAVWDYLFNSLLLSKEQAVKSFGLDNKGINRQNLKKQWRGIKS